MYGPLSSTRNCFHYLRHRNVKLWKDAQKYVLTFPQISSARYGLIFEVPVPKYTIPELCHLGSCTGPMCRQVISRHSAYRQVSNIRRTKSKTLNVSCLVLQLSLPSTLKSGIKWRMKMQLEQRRQAMLQLHLSDQQFHCLVGCDLYERFYGTYRHHMASII